MNKNNLLIILLSTFLLFKLAGSSAIAAETLSQTTTPLPIAKLKANVDSVEEPYDPNRPKAKFVDSIVDAKYQPYVNSCLTKILRVAEVRSSSPDLSGKVRLTMEIWSDGLLHGIAINKSSGNKKLDDEVVKQITYAAPFASFPAAIKQEADILFLTTEWALNSADGKHLSLVSD